MSRPVSRRGLIQAGTAALGAVGLPAATVALADALPASTGPDAALAALIARHTVIDGEYQVAAEQWEDLYSRWCKMRPARPAALTARACEGLGAYPARDQLPDGSIRLIYGEEEVEQIRAATLKPKWIGSDKPCPIAVARRAEVIAAYDGWKAECDAIADRIGLPAANAKATEAANASVDIETAILAHQPRTLAGFVVKAKWISAQTLSSDDWAEQMVRDLCAVGEVA